MKSGSSVTDGIYLRWDSLQEFMGELALLAVEPQARQLGMRPLNLHRARHGNRLGERVIIEILAGTKAIARRRQIEPPAFETLFEVRAAEPDVPKFAPIASVEASIA